MMRSHIYFADVIALSLKNERETIQYLIDHSQGNGVIVREDLNAFKFLLFERNVSVRECLLKADIVNADGMSIVWASKMLVGENIPRVTGCDLYFGLVKECYALGKKIYLLGATEEIINKVANDIQLRYGDRLVVGKSNGYFDDDKLDQLINEINSCDPDFLFIGMPSPRKEEFICYAKDKLNIDVILMGVGGTFDVAAGKVNRAPGWIQKIGLEWLYRLLQEPRRMWKRTVVTNTVFLYRFLLMLLKK